MPFGATVTELFESAKDYLALQAQSSWPNATQMVAMVQDVMEDVQYRTGFGNLPVTAAYVTPWTAYTLTGKDPASVKLIDVWNLTKTTKYAVVDIEVIRQHRLNTVSLGTGVYVFALDTLNATVGTMTIEVYPAFTTNTSVLCTINAVPELAAQSVSATVNLPRSLMVPGLAWKMAISRVPSKAQYFFQMYIDACNNITAKQAITGRAEPGARGGFLDARAGR